MNDKVDISNEIDIFELIQTIWFQKKYILKWLIVFFVLGLILTFANPKEYKAEVTLLIESSNRSAGMSGFFQQFGGLNGMNLTNSNGESLTPELYPDIIKSKPFLLGIMDQSLRISKFDSAVKVSEYIQKHVRPGLINVFFDYTFGLPGKMIGWIKGKPKFNPENILKDEKGPLRISSEQSSIANALTNRIKTKSGSSNTLIISVELQDPVAATILVDSVVESLTKYVTGYKVQKEKEDLRFIQERCNEAEKRFIMAQNNLAGHQDRNRNVVLASVQSKEQNLKAEYDLSFNLYNTLSQQLEQAKIKVQEKTPIFKILEPATVPLGKSSPTIFTTIKMIILGTFLGILIVIIKFIREKHA